ncbi:MAG TPA: hypothetical protein VFT66_06655 [Roseiflexaceae bacterium]|nr:hypothetical protein [Roseiflexaceae bacterium]
MKSNNQLMLSTWSALTIIGLPVAYLSRLLAMNVTLIACRSSNLGTGPAVVYVSFMTIFIIPFFIFKNRKHQFQYTLKSMVPSQHIVGAMLVSAMLGIIGLIIPYLLICASEKSQPGRLLFLVQALKGSWLGLAIVGSWLVFVTYAGLMVFFSVIPALKVKLQSRQ